MICSSVPTGDVCLLSKRIQANIQLQVYCKLHIKAHKLPTVNTCLVLDKHRVQKPCRTLWQASAHVAEQTSISKILLSLLSCHGKERQSLYT